MRYRNYSFVFLLVISLFLSGCNENLQTGGKVRPLADTIGFAQYDYQMDEVMGQVSSVFGKLAYLKMKPGNWPSVPTMIMPTPD